MKKNLGLITFILIVGSWFLSRTVEAQTAIEAKQTGNWSDGATWGGEVPTDVEGDIIIPSDITVTLDTDVECGQIIVEGRFEIERADRALTCDSLIVMGENAEFEVGTDADRFTHRFVLTLKGDKSETFAMGGGARALMAMGGGTINIHGEDRVEWTHLGANATADSDFIEMSEPVDWRIGDEILICSSRRQWDEAEKRTILDVSEDRKYLELNQPLEYPHAGVSKNYTRTTPDKTWTADLRAEVGLLSRNITIQGAEDSVTEGDPNQFFGAHIMIHGPMMNAPTGRGYIKGVELYRVGQKKLLGRYPFHWHLVQGEGNGQYFSDNAVHHSFNRAITIHGTDYTKVENNFCYDHIGHGIFLEDGAERYNVIKKNVVALTKRPAPDEQLTPSDNQLDEQQNRTPASFWITNPENTFEDNVAAGTEGTGYWFIMPKKPLEPSRSLDYYEGSEPFKAPLISFKGNKAHSCANGFDIFDQLSDEHAISKNRGWENSGQQVMEDCTWYANGIAVYAGIGTAGYRENIIYRDNIFVDNGVGLMLATYNITEDSLFVADSGENLTSGARYLYRAYDGAGRVRNCHFVGWNAPNVNFISNIGGATKHPNHRFSGITTDHEGSVRLELKDYSINPPPGLAVTNDLHPRRWSLVLRDEDGSLSGVANSSIVCNHPFQLVGGELKPENWIRAYISPYHFALAIEDPGSDRPNVTVGRSKEGTPDAWVYYVNGDSEHHQLPVIVNEDFTYTYYYENLPNNYATKFRLDDATVGDHVVACFKDFGKLPGIQVSGEDDHLVSSHGSLASLKSSNSSGYYIEANGDLYLRPVATGKNQIISVNWNNNINWRTFDSDGDSLTDGEEAGRADRNPFSLNDLGSQFAENDNFEGWDEHYNISELMVNDGALKGFSQGDAQIINGDFNFPASQVSLLIIRMKANVNSAVKVYWERSDASGYSTERMEILTYSGASDWQNLYFPLIENNEWSGTITSIRIDPLDVEGSFEMESISVSDGDLDDDGIPDLTEGFSDIDGDGIANALDLYSDGDGHGDAFEYSEGRNAHSASDLGFRYSDTADFEGWETTSGIADKTVAGGIYSGNATTKNPRMINSSFHFNAAEVKEILVRMKVSQVGQTKLFFITEETEDYVNDRKVVVSTPPAGTWGIARFKVFENENWQGRITNLRFHPNNIAGTTFDIDWILASDGDLDDDGISDELEGAADLDGDGLANVEDRDSDGDGAPDKLESSLNRNPYANNEAENDADGDGDSDLWEMITGFSPDDQNSRFSSSLDMQASGGRKMIFDAKPGRKYILYQSFDLLEWNSVQTKFSNETDGKMEFNDTSTIPDGRCFYQIGIELLD